MNTPAAPALPGAVSPAPVGSLPARPDGVHHEPPSGGGAGPGPADPAAVRRARLLQSASILILCPVAGIGAVLSFRSLHEAAAPVFGSFAAGFPLLVDMLILGSTLAYLGGASLGRALPGWRWTAHAGVAGTLLLNALAASGPATIAWHITPALVWSVLVEMTARQVTGSSGSPTAGASEPIPIRIWFSSPLIAAGTWLQMARTGQRCHRQARADLAVQVAARHALSTALPQWRQRGARRRIGRQLRAGALEPAVVLDYLRGRHQDTGSAHHTAMVLQAFLRGDADRMSVTCHCGAQDSGAPDPHPPGTSQPGQSPAEPVPAPRTTNDTRRPSRHPEGLRRSSRSPQDHHQRRQAAVGILRTRPGIDGPQLAQELTDLGWPVSARTARRVLAQANHDVAGSAPDEQAPTRPGRASP